MNDTGYSSPTGDRYFVLYDYVAKRADELTMRKGEFLWVVDDLSGDPWPQVRNSAGEEGRVPSNYIELIGGGGGQPTVAIAIAEESNESFPAAKVPKSGGKSDFFILGLRFY